MEDYYIVKDKTEIIEPGSLFKYDKGKVTWIDPKFKSINLDIIAASIKVTLIEVNYLNLFSIRDRIIKHELFGKVNQLLEHDECYLKNEGRCTIVKKFYQGGNLKFIIQIKKDKEKTIWAWEIESVVEYYICVRGYARTKPGDIIAAEGGAKKVYPRGPETRISNECLEKISREEAMFMVRCPLGKRMMMHDGRLWEAIDKLSVGDRCCLSEGPKGTLYTIMGINKGDDNIECKLQPRAGECLTVDVSSIRPQTSEGRATLDDGGAAGRTKGAASTGSRKTAVTCTPTGSATKVYTGVNSREEAETKDPPFIQCKSSGLIIIDTNMIRIIGKQEHNIEERTLVIKGGQHTARLRWKGFIDGIMCIGCELDVASEHGCSGKVVDEELFRCERKKGIFVPLIIDGNSQTCEGEDGQRHSEMRKNTDKVIEEDGICCFDGAPCKEGGAILADGTPGKWKWRGNVNGADCVGLEVAGTNMIKGYERLGLMGRLKLFPFISSYGGLFDVKDVTLIVTCGANKVNIVDPSCVRSDSEAIGRDRLMALRQGSNDMVVSLSWKGRINGVMCLGCQLGRDCEYGTDGTFNGRRLFHSEDKRGVLIVEESVDCCGRDGRRHTKITNNYKMLIEDKCICCAERRADLIIAGHIRAGNRIILKEDVCGTVKWTGMINGEESVGVETDDYRFGSDGTFGGMRLFTCISKQGVLMKVSDISRRLKCDQIDLDVLNPIFVDNVTNIVKVSASFFITKGTKKAVKVRCRCDIEDVPYLGCLLPNKHKYGTRGTFNGQSLFECDDDRAVLIDQRSLLYGCLSTDGPHKVIKKMDDCYIVEDSICCVQTLNNLSEKSEIAVGCKVTLKDNPCECLWVGLVNGEEAVGLSSAPPYKKGTDGTFCGVKLFESSTRQAVLCFAEGLRLALEVPLVRDIYVSKTFDLSKRSQRRSGDMIGKLVSFQDDPPIHGRVRYYLSLSGQLFVAINVVEDDADKYASSLKDVIIRGSLPDEDRLVVVRDKSLESIKEELQMLQGSNVVDETWIKVRESSEAKDLKIGDVVKYENDNGIFFGRIDKLELLNGVRCVGVVDRDITGGDKGVIYLQENAVSRIIPLRYLEDTIIDPTSVKSIKRSNDDDMKEKDEVEFILRHSKKKFEGIIFMFVEINDVHCALIGLRGIPDKFNMSPYQMTSPEIPKMYQKEKTVAVPTHCIRLVQKKMFLCKDNNIPIFDPARAKEVSAVKTADKLITFTSNGEKVVAWLKMTGRVGTDACIGCEMRKKCQYGTDGTFGGRTLFDCADGRGVLIPLNGIKDHCVNGSHKSLGSSADGRVIESSVCCAEMVEELRRKDKLQIGKRVMRISDNGKIFGVCRWIGLVNQEEVIGVDMAHGGGVYERMDRADLVCRLLKEKEMFLANDFTYDHIGLCYCSSNGLLVVDPRKIDLVEKGCKLKKKMVFESELKKTVVLDIRWRGCVNEVLCVGCHLINESDCETGGVFGGKELFDCLPRRGVLIPVERLSGSCEYGTHRPVDKYESLSIKEGSICCVETLHSINKWPQMKIGSRVTYNKAKYWNLVNQKKEGECKWMGLVNEKEVVGLVMRERNVEGGTNGRFSVFDLFLCKDRCGVLFLCDDVEHDIKGEALPFVRGKFVDVSKIWKVKKFDSGDTRGLEIGDFVSTYLIDQRGSRRILKGELKWIGIINGELCVGIDLEEKYDIGMDGVIKGKHSFRCDPGHGVVTTMDNVDLSTDEVRVCPDGTIDARQCLRCKEGWNEEYLRERGVSRGGFIFVEVDIEDGGRRKKKGTLRWGGTMNGVSVAVVELSEDYDGGSDGRFWRESVIRCKDKRAVAVQWEKIHPYFPYEKMTIPIDDRRFNVIDVNSAVIYYVPRDGTVVSYYGTVKWTGRNDKEEYYYGIELDDKYDSGTDGTFNNIRLFHCQNGHGVLVSMEVVAPDTRFSAPKEEEIPESQTTYVVQYSIPIKSHRGENKGIQGNANSCYFDSSIFALFSKSDVLDFMISPVINEVERDKTTKEFREAIAFKIVYPLRRYGLVSYHHTEHMRAIIERFGGKFKEMTKHETDMENVASLLSKLCKDEQLLSLKSYTGHINKMMFLQLFVIMNKPVLNISSQQMLDLSMAQNDIMFNEPPTCLIMQAPRDAKGINCYNNVFPSQTIEISNMCFQCRKKCLKCAKEAVSLCKICVEESLRTACGLFCRDHSCRHDNTQRLPQSEVASTSEVQMTLKAIICIEKAHFVAYVKEDEFKKEWVYFDSMSTQGLANNFAVPMVKYVKEVSHFLNLNESEMKNHCLSYHDDSLKRILKDSYIFVYHNTAKTCY